MPRVHASGFPETYGFEEELFFDWSQMAALFFRAHGASRMRTCTIQNSNQIKQKQKTFKQNSPRKEWNGENIHKHFCLRKFWIFK